MPAGEEEARIRVTATALAAFAPRDEIEAMIAGQAVAERKRNPGLGPNDRFGVGAEVPASEALRHGRRAICSRASWMTGPDAPLHPGRLPFPCGRLHFIFAAPGS